MRSLEFDEPGSPLDDALAEDRLCPQVIAAIRAVPILGRIIMADGFTIDAPDTPENQAKYPQSSSQAEGLGFPIIRCSCLVSMLTGMLINLGHAAYSGKGTGETAAIPGELSFAGRRALKVVILVGSWCLAGHGMPSRCL